MSKIQFGDRFVFFDGATGTQLQEMGLAPGHAPELWNLERPQAVRQVHASYLEAGAQVINANTFGANPLKEEELGVPAETLVKAGVALAREAVAQSGKEAFVALDIGPTGKLLAPLGDLPFEQALNAFAQVVEAGAQAGADCVLIETMNDLYEAKAAVLAAKEHCSLPVFVTMTFDEEGKLLTGGTLEAAAAVLEGLGVDALGLNCGLGPQQMLSLTRRLRKLTSLPILVDPNAGLPREEEGRTVFDVGPEEFAGWMEEIAKAGAQALGGCCGTTPAHIAALTARCGKLSPLPAPPCLQTVVASGMEAVSFGQGPVLIGERINPTGKPKLKQALREKNIAYLLGEGIAQQDAGAHVLDVNVGLPEIDEPELMCQVIRELQGVTPLPLQIDTADPVTMEKALRLYNGKALVNSVTAKASSMEAIFPLVRKYGGVVIGLTITEEGIPETAQGRLEAARLIVETAQSYGIAKKDLVIDPLTMAVSAGEDAAQVTLEALDLIHRELGVYTSLGVSNVSFGLPQREKVTCAFFLMALQRGLGAAIMNPRSQAMMDVYRSFRVLTGKDPNCMDYIAAYGESAPAPAAPAQTGYTLQEAIVKGLKDQAYARAKEQAASRPGLEIINGEIVPALDQVGAGFEKKTLFLPQLLMSAEAAKAAFEAVQDCLGTAGAQKRDLSIVLATVKGDVHDIGKNIVKVLLENYGFQVTDLGKDVPPEAVLRAAKETGAGLVGLSALMTTTVPAMRDTIELLRRELPGCKVMVGGAVLTQEYADQIGADFYGPDAMASVRYALSLEEG